MIEEISKALKKIEDQKSVWLSLTDLFDDKKNKIRHASLWLIANLFSDQDSFNDILVEAIKDDDPAIRMEAIKILFRLKHETNVTLFFKMAIEDENPEVRMAAVSGLRFSDNDEILPQLIKKLEEKDSERLPNIINAMGDMMDESASDTLEKMFRETTDPHIKILAADAINKIGNYNDPAFLIEGLLLLTDKSSYDPETVNSAYRLLVEIPGGDKIVYRPIQDAISNNEYEKVIELIGNEDVLIPDDVNLFWWRGIAFLYKKEFNRALSDFNITIKLNPYFKNVYYFRSLTFVELKNFDEALKDAVEAVNSEPDSILYLNHLGWIQYETKTFIEAIMNFNKALDIANNNLNINFNLGLAYLANNQQDEAIKQYKQAMNFYTKCNDDEKEKILIDARKDLEELTDLNKDLKPRIDIILSLLK